MNKIIKLILILLILQASVFSGSQLQADESKLITPELQGFTLKSEPAIYTSDTLYEYINGAADLYLGYYFNKLTVFDYRNKTKGAITVDVYEHKDINNGYGIYCSERPTSGNFLKIGTQGYYEQGILNFFKGKYYVKISSFGIREKEKEVLSKLAEKFASQFKDELGNPKVISAFPENNRVKNSGKFIAKNFLGHSFLHSAFTQDYSINNSEYQVFIIETEDAKDINNLLESYKGFLKKKAAQITEKDGILSFIDPYYKNKGTMYLRYKNNHLWGLFCKDEKKARGIINFISDKLK